MANLLSPSSEMRHILKHIVPLSPLECSSGKAQALLTALSPGLQEQCLPLVSTQ